MLSNLRKFLPSFSSTSDEFFPLFSDALRFVYNREEEHNIHQKFQPLKFIASDFFAIKIYRKRTQPTRKHKILSHPVLRQCCRITKKNTVSITKHFNSEIFHSDLCFAISWTVKRLKFLCFYISGAHGNKKRFVVLKEWMTWNSVVNAFNIPLLKKKKELREAGLKTQRKQTTEMFQSLDGVKNRKVIKCIMFRDVWYGRPSLQSRTSSFYVKCVCSDEIESKIKKLSVVEWRARGKRNSYVNSKKRAL